MLKAFIEWKEKITVVYLDMLKSNLYDHYLKSIVTSSLNTKCVQVSHGSFCFYSICCSAKIIEGLGKSSSWVYNSIQSSVEDRQITDSMKRIPQNKVAPVTNINNNQVHQWLLQSFDSCEKQILLHRLSGRFLSSF